MSEVDSPRARCAAVHSTLHVAAIPSRPLPGSVTEPQTGPSVKIHVCTVVENGTTKAIPRTLDELRIYVVASASPSRGPMPDPGPSERWR